MRLFKITTEVYDDRETTIPGDKPPVTGAECTIDLDRVESTWRDLDGTLVLDMYSGRSIRVRGMSLAEFDAVWLGENGTYCKRMSKEVSKRSFKVNGDILPKQQFDVKKYIREHGKN
jgi:hypothetical protein